MEYSDSNSKKALAEQADLRLEYVPSPPDISEILTRPLPYLNGSLINRVLIRTILILLRRQIKSINGEEILLKCHDPFIVAVNHSQWLEAVLLPALIVWSRGGRMVHFLADWNFLLMPLAGFIFWRGEVIPVTRKRAKPAILTYLRKYLVKKPHGYERARLFILNGKSVGIFPEGTTNRDLASMLGGQRGAARLSLETTAPVLPIGIRFPDERGKKRVSPFAPMEIHIGELLYPPTGHSSALSSEINHMHERIMSSIATLAGKTWSLNSKRRNVC